MNKKLSDWASIAEIVSGIAIVVTIVVLIVEVRSNSGMLARQMELERVDRNNILFINSLVLPAIHEKIKAVDSEFVNAATTAFMGQYNLSFTEAEQWVRFQTQRWRQFEADFLFGDVESNQFFAFVLSNPDNALYWEHSADIFDPAFVQFVERQVAWREVE